VEVIHIPGDLMIEEGTDRLSRGLWLLPQCIYRFSLTEASLALGQVRFTAALGQWILELVGLSPYERYSLHCSISRWSFQDIFRQVSMWIPTPEIARQALVKYLDIWVEEATTTAGIFLVPRIMQRNWGNIFPPCVGNSDGLSVDIANGLRIPLSYSVCHFVCPAILTLFTVTQGRRTYPSSSLPAEMA
jgi:hypothetical protein